MKASAYWKAVTVDREEFLGQLLQLLSASGVRYCVIGGLAVNAYAEPVVSLDLDVVVDLNQVETVVAALARRYAVERFGYTINVTARHSDIRVQIRTDPRFHAFLPSASPREVLGITMSVAKLEDVLQSKIWAALDATRRRSKRQNDLADVARLLEAHPDLQDRVPSEILARLV
jgi:hypothetical protein